MVIAILGKELSEKLQLMPDLMLNKVVELVRQSEQVKQHIKEQGANANFAQVSEVVVEIQSIKEPIEGCVPMITLPKNKDQPRICVGLKWLNKSVSNINH